VRWRPLLMILPAAALAGVVLAQHAGAVESVAAPVRDDAHVQRAVEGARRRFLAGQRFDRLDVAVLLAAGGAGWLRGSVGGDQPWYPASCVKLGFAIAAVRWCAERLLAPDGLLDRMMAEDGPLERLTAQDGAVERLTAKDGVIDRALAENGILETLLAENGAFERLIAEGGPLDQIVALSDTLTSLAPNLERMSASIEVLQETVGILSAAVGPLGELAGKLPNRWLKSKSDRPGPDLPIESA